MKNKINKKFVKYYKSKFKAYSEAARFFGTARATVHFWMHGKVNPSANNIQSIAKKTNNAVPAESWFV